MSENFAVKIHWVVANPKSNGNLTKNKEYKGIGAHLFAIAAKISFDKGYDGFVQAKAANRKLLEYYICKLGAKFISGYNFYLDDIASKKLLEKCNWRDE